VRPSQLLPALMPPISIPGHASFPSGHATQSALISLCVQQALPGADFSSAVPIGTPTPGSTCAAMQPGLDALAARIARNREIAGLHYPSDTVGGQMLATNIFQNILLKASSTVLNSYFEVLKFAKLEWPTP
jgi:membrane-associated phospholipid phosphatase